MMLGWRQLRLPAFRDNGVDAPQALKRRDQEDRAAHFATDLVDYDRLESEFLLSRSDGANKANSSNIDFCVRSYGLSQVRACCPFRMLEMNQFNRRKSCRPRTRPQRGIQRRRSPQARAVHVHESVRSQIIRPSAGTFRRSTVSAQLIESVPVNTMANLTTAGIGGS
jgi:hypothetical protein